MNVKTRYFVIASLLVLCVGLGTGLVAYYVGRAPAQMAPPSAFDELRYVPSDAAVVAYANVRDVMQSDLRRRLHRTSPAAGDGQREFRDRTGIDIETDIDRVVACVEPREAERSADRGLAIARGRFDRDRIESLVRDRGGRVEEHNGQQLFVVPRPADRDGARAGAPRGPRTDFALAFVEPGLVLVGSAPGVRAAIDARRSGRDATTNPELMDRLRSLDGTAWAVGRFDELRSAANLPPGVADQIPPITWFSVSSHIDGGISGVVRADTRDEQAANNLRDVVRGFLALAKMQTGGRPELQAALQSLDLSGDGRTVALSFDLPSRVFDLLGSGASNPQPAR